jgi:hypothetical protein
MLMVGGMGRPGVGTGPGFGPGVGTGGVFGPGIRPDGGLPDVYPGDG